MPDRPPPESEEDRERNYRNGQEILRSYLRTLNRSIWALAFGRLVVPIVAVVLLIRTGVVSMSLFAAISWGIVGAIVLVATLIESRIQIRDAEFAAHQHYKDTPGGGKYR